MLEVTVLGAWATDASHPMIGIIILFLLESVQLVTEDGTLKYSAWVHAPILSSSRHVASDKLICSVPQCSHLLNAGRRNTPPPPPPTVL